MKKTIQFLVSLGCLALAVNSLEASTANWVGGSGNWTSVTPTVPGWTNADATYPDGIGQGANITVNQTGIRNVTLDISVTVGTVGLYSGGTGDSRVSNIKGLGTLTLDNGANKPTIISASGNLGTNSVCVNIAGINGLRAPVSGGKIALAAANTYTGDTEVFRRILAIKNVDALPYGSRSGNVILIRAGNPGDVANLHFQDLDSATINGLSSILTNLPPSSEANPLVDAETAPSGTFTLSVGDNDANGIYAGDINDGGSAVALTKIGKGKQVLTNGVYNYSGATTVNEGTLAVAGSIPNSTIKVNAGGNISAGASVGTMTFSTALDLSAGGTNIWELAANSDSNPGLDYDQIVQNGGTLDLTDSTLIVSLIGSVNTGDVFWNSSHTWTVINSPFALAGSSNFKAIEVVGGTPPGNFTTANNGSAVTLTFTPGVVPFKPPRVKITSVVPNSPSPTSVTVTYTNTVSGTNYVLQYRTDVNTGAWTSVKTNAAAGTTSSSTDTTTTGSAQRFYRVYGQF